MFQNRPSAISPLQLACTLSLPAAVGIAMAPKASARKRCAPGAAAPAAGAAQAPKDETSAIPQSWPEAEVQEAPVFDKDAEIVARLENPQEHGGVLVSAKWIVQRLVTSGLASKCTIAPSQLGIHPQNRSTYGVNEEEIHRLGSDIMDMGFSLEEIAQPWCVQEDPKDLYITKKNQELCNSSEVLAPITGPIVAGTLTNGHVTLLLRCLLAGMPCQVEKLSISGKMNLAHVREQSEEMFDAAMHGWEWTMIHHQVRHLYGPGIFAFLSDAKNVQLTRKETEVQVLLKATNIAIKLKEQTGEINWDTVHSKILQTKPDCSSYANSLLRFSKLYAGGADGGFMADLARFHAKFVPAGRAVGGSFFEQLCNLQFKNEEKQEVKTPLLKHALLKASYRCPPEAVHNNICTYISQSDFNKLAKNKAKDCLDAELVLRSCRELLLLADKSVPALERSKLFGVLDVNVARILLGKQKDSNVQYKNIYEAAHMFFQEASKFGLSSNPWAQYAPAATPAKPKPAESSDMHNYSCSGAHIPGDIKGELGQKGFKIGTKVLHKKSKDPTECLEITDIDKVVKLTSTDVEGSISEVSVGDLMSKFNIYQEEYYPSGAGHSAKTNEMYIKHALRSSIASALYSLTSAIETPKVKVVAKPYRKVVAESNFKVGELVLVPDSLGVSHGTASDKPHAASLVKTSFTAPDPNHIFYLLAPNMSTDAKKKTIVAPFWLIGKTQDESKVNMEYSTMSVKLCTEIAGKAKQSGQNNEKIEFEILRNTKAIQVGDELLAFSPPPDSKGPQQKKPRKS